jgi:hypothetical protein
VADADLGAARSKRPQHVNTQQICLSNASLHHPSQVGSTASSTYILAATAEALVPRASVGMRMLRINIDKQDVCATCPISPELSLSNGDQTAAIAHHKASVRYLSLYMHMKRETHVVYRLPS